MRIDRRIALAMSVFLLASISGSALGVERGDIDEKYKWDPDDIYSSMDGWDADFQKIKDGLDKLVAFKGKFAGKDADDPAGAMIEFHKISEDIEIRFSHVYGYVMYNFHVDLGNPEWNGRLQQLQNLGVEFGERLAWVEPEMLQIPEETMMKYIDENPELEPYRKGMKDMYLLQEHVLSEPEEAILALSGNITGTASEVFGKLTDVDMTFDPIVDENGDTIKVTDSGWGSWRVNKNREIREAYFKSLWSGYNHFGNTLAALMTGNLKKDVYMMKARKFDNTLQMKLSNNFIPEAVYFNLVETTRANTAPLQKYNEIRKRMLGVDHYRHWDYYVDLSNADDTRYTWEEGVEMVKEALAPLGEDYIRNITEGLNPSSGWVDVFANDGKRGGAYSSSCYGIHPYMLFNFDYKKGLTLDDVSTIAHEVGHSMHTLYSERNQPFPTKDYAIFNAEVASVTNEMLFGMKRLDETRKAYKKAKGEEKIAAKEKLISLLVQSLGTARGTFFRQTMFATWELEAHKMAEEGQPLTKESFSELYGNLLAEFHGPAAEYEEMSNISWARIPHFYRGYYVYTYATSYSAAVALAKSIRMEHFGNRQERKAHKGATEKYLNYLKSGSSKHPVELLQDAGVDMTTPEPFLECIGYFSELVDELDELTTVK